MGKSIVSIVKGNDIEKMVTEALFHLGGVKKLIRPKSTVVIKPNAGHLNGPDTSVNTNPDVVAAVIKEIRKANPKEIILAESAAIGCDTMECLEISGIKKAAEEAGLDKIIDIKKEYPDAAFIAHPECEKPVLMVADFIGSTTALLKYSREDDHQKFIVATESGILHQMQKDSPEKSFIPAPSIDSTCGCNDCSFMKLNTMEKLYLCLKYEKPEILLDADLMDKARQPIERMLEVSAKLNI